MKETWTPEEVRIWILQTLLEIYMKSPQTIVFWGPREMSEATAGEHPNWGDIYRECEWLDWKDYISAQFSIGSIAAKITPKGREFVENNIMKAS